jgi:hypothetical protein
VEALRCSIRALSRGGDGINRGHGCHHYVDIEDDDIVLMSLARWPRSHPGRREERLECCVLWIFIKWVAQIKWGRCSGFFLILSGLECFYFSLFTFRISF